MNLLEMNHIEKKFDDLQVLKDISLAVEEGEIVSIIGPSGSGKSTLLRCATMLETIDRGEIVYLGEKAAWTENGQKKAVYAKKDRLRQIQKNYGLVFQNFNLFPHFSVIKNITDAPIHVQGKPKEQALQALPQNSEDTFPPLPADPEHGQNGYESGSASWQTPALHIQSHS